MLRKILIPFFFLLPFYSSATISPENLKTLKNYEDSLKVLGDSVINGSQQVERQTACYDFIRTLVKALKVDNSFEYPFDSLTTIGILYSEDKSFRIFNWNLLYINGTYRYYGAIQRNTGNLKIFPLYDYHRYFVKDPVDTITSNERWYGAQYYKILKQGKYYMLFGWDGNNMRSNKKIIDVLTFDKKKGTPIFGAPIFNVGTGKSAKIHDRFILEYKKDAQVSINYDPNIKMIVYDHLIPIDPKAEGLYFTYVPDGSYEGFVFKRKKWQYVSSVFNGTQQTPFPDPIKFDKPKPNYQNKKGN